MRINRSIRRLAKMTGAKPPSDQSLEQRLERRMLSLDVSSGIARRFNFLGDPRDLGDSDVQLEKRFNRVGVLKHRLKRQVAPITAANPPTAPNSLGLDIDGQDDGYLATVQMGTPPQNFTILMDSGSADLWVGSENCISEQGACGNHVFLGPESSSTFTNTPKAFNVSYGEGHVTGTVIQDNVVIGGLTLSSHTFGVANQESANFATSATPFDGLMGLAKSSLSTQQTPTPIEALASTGLVSAAIVSYKLGRAEDNDNDGEITFGGLDSTKFEANTLVNLPNVNTEGFWESNLDGVSVNGTDLGLTGRTTILDTGTTLMLLPQSDAVLIHQNIPGAQSDGQGGFLVPCTTNASVALTYGGQLFTIDPRDIARQAVNDSSEGLCVSGISTDPEVVTGSLWLVGDTFLKNAYFSTDVTNNSLSLAKLV